MSILSWLGGGVLDKLLTAHSKHQDTAVEHDKTRAKVLEAQISSELERQRLANQVRLATAGFWEMRLITGTVAGCFTLHLLLVTLDTCFAFGWKISAFPAPFDQWQGTILLSLFGVGVLSRGITAATTAWMSKR